jgi:2,3,4,5-tetrahydropyridine-2-carboxylate N-succinyltransferase
MLADDIDAIWSGEMEPDGDVLDEFVAALDAGEVRAAEKRDGSWEANEWVKRGILLCFRHRDSERLDYGGVAYHDKFDLKDTSGFIDTGARNTPDGTVIREGAHVGSDAILMSPCFVNVGARVGDGTLVDSCDTVGSCAQVGSDVKLGANALIGGVLEPVEDAPVVIEDGVSVGAGSRLTSGVVVGEDSVLAEDTLLNPSIPVFDFVEDEVVFGRVPPERRVMQRFVESSIEGFGETFYKPACVATALDDDTLEKTRKEDALRE